MSMHACVHACVRADVHACAHVCGHASACAHEHARMSACIQEYLELLFEGIKPLVLLNNVVHDRAKQVAAAQDSTKIVERVVLVIY